MLIIPAIDMKDHKVVRLKQGDMDQSIVYNECVTNQAEKWIAMGAKRLHLVDLNGAFEGQPVHFDEIEKIAKAYPGVKIQVGGGIRNAETMKRYYDVGVHACILGTIAVKDPDFVKNVCESFPGRVILGLDAKDGLVRVEGWAGKTEINAFEFVEQFHGLELDSIVYTDISKDGMLSGMNHEGLRRMQEKGIPLIASGGLTGEEDLDFLF